jgi:uncharacterized protein (DUF433 family)
MKHGCTVDLDTIDVMALSDPWNPRTELMNHPRITIRSDQMAGAPCIRGLRIPVARVVAMVANGMSVETILSDYPDLEAADIPAALHYAAEAVRERAIPIPGGV